MTFLRRALVAICGVFVAGHLAYAQTPAPGQQTAAASVANYALTQQMPVDPEATLGSLPNGLRYYVRPNGRPAGWAELRLVVKAGSVLEDDDQRGMAHFVEHMAFEGTRHFPRQGLNDFLAALGVSIGPDVNAATSYDDTQYSLRIPTDKPGVLDRALLVLEDWAQDVSFDQEGIDRERPVVLSEWRERLSAEARTADQIRAAELAGSRYAVRPPIGDPMSIQQVQRAQLTRFYHDWYRPDLMAVIVVGDIDRATAVSLIQSHFAGLRAPAPKRPRPVFDVPEHSGTRYAIVTDREATTTEVMISDLRPARNQGSVGGYRSIMRDQLFGAMLGARLEELSQRADAPFLQAAADRELFPAPRTRDEAALQAVVAPDGVERGLDALITELQRVIRFGFTDTELVRAKQIMQRNYERDVTESPDRESASRAAEYTRNFLEDEALPTIQQELAFHNRFLPGITLAEMNGLATDWFPDANRLIVVAAPDATGVTLPDQPKLEAAVRMALARPAVRYVDEGATEALMNEPPHAGTIVQTTEHPEAGITEWTLSNGAKVVLKPTTLKTDQIFVRAFAPGGTSLADDADLIPARVAAEVVGAGGVGRFSAITLAKVLAGRAVAVIPFISDIDEGVRGESTPDDLPTLFQLMYLRFTAPRADQAAFAAVMAQAKALLANETADPEVVLNQKVEDLLSNHDPRRQPETLMTVAQWDLARSLAFYRARFADASNFTFVFVGSFTPEALKPLVETYIASLPATHARETWRDVDAPMPNGVQNVIIRQGIAPKSEVTMVLFGPFVPDEAHRLELRTTGLILESRLFGAIRQELGGTYSITVNTDTQSVPRPAFRVRIDWTCDPAQTDALVQRVLDEIASVRALRLDVNQVALIKENLLRQFARDVQNNGYLLTDLVRRYAEHADPSSAAIDRQREQIENLTSSALQQAAQDYLDTNRYVKVTLLPSK